MVRPQQKIILFGDSITQGLGSKKINFTTELANKLGESYSIENLAFTGTMIDYGLEIAKKKSFSDGDICVIVYGNVDAQIRPNQNGFIYPLIPRRFHGTGMLMPRPFYSSKPWKRLIQKMENIGREFFSKLIILVDGTEQWKDVAAFSEDYQEMVRLLKGHGATVVCCSTVYIDEHLFPKGTLEEYREFNEIIQGAAERHGDVFVDLFSLLKWAVDKNGWNQIYNYDHFHPNTEGYELIANRLAFEISRIHQDSKSPMVVNDILRRSEGA